MSAFCIALFYNESVSRAWTEDPWSNYMKNGGGQTPKFDPKGPNFESVIFPEGLKVWEVCWKE